MKRIDEIEHLSKLCTGCMACVDACPVGCISVVTSHDGFLYSKIDALKCIECGKCYSVCPIEQSEKNNIKQHLYASCSLLPGAIGGLSGTILGIFRPKD